MLYIVVILAIIVVTAYYIFMWPKSSAFGYYPYGLKTDKKIVALSFDDGPSAPYTGDLLAILAKYKVPATFFLVGKNVEKNPELARSIVAAGQIIGNHAYSHKLSKYLNEPDLRSEIEQTQQIIFEATGKKTVYFRSPWLIRNPGMFRVLKENKMTPISGIFGTQKEVYLVSAEQIFSDACSHIKPGQIMIFHDGVNKNGNRSQTVKAMDLFIPELKKRGYEIVSLETLLGIPAYT